MGRRSNSRLTRRWPDSPGCAPDGFRAVRRNDDALVSLALLGEVAAALQDREAAQALYDALVPRGRLNLVFEQAWAAFGSLSRQLGLLAAALDRPADAAQHL